MALDLDRIAVEAAGADPACLAAAIIEQLPDLTGAVPVYDIARALDIEEIRETPLSSLEGCLLTDPCKSYGSILVNAASSPRRRRYTVAHELGHFLNERHVPTTQDGVRCTREDMAYPTGSCPHLRQEREANRFAIELLAPRMLIQPHLCQTPNLEHVLAISEALDISREAAARRYVALHEAPLAVVFLAKGRIRYLEKGHGFPHTRVWTNDTAPMPVPRPKNGLDLTKPVEVDPQRWLSRADGAALVAQTLFQADGYAMTLLRAER